MNWKEDKNITDCKRNDNGTQRIKNINYHDVYVNAVLDGDSIRE